MSTNVINFDEAEKYAHSMENATTREAASYFLSRLIIKILRNDTPEHLFDALYLVKLVEFAFENEPAIQRILRGETEDWFDS